MANDVDDLLGDDAPAPKKAKKTAAAAPAKAAKAAPAKAAKAAPAKAAKAAKAAPAKKGKAAAAEEKEKTYSVGEDNPIRKALLKVRKAISYADFADANDFNIRSVRRTARVLRDNGEIDLVRDGQTVLIQPAV